MGSEVFDPWHEESRYGNPQITSSLYSKRDMIENVLLNMGFVIFSEDKEIQYFYKKDGERQTMVRLSDQPRIKELVLDLQQTTDFSSIEELYEHMKRSLDEEDAAKFFDMALNMR